MKRRPILAVCPADWLGVKASISHGADAYSDIAGARAAIRSHDPRVVRFGGYSPAWRRILRFARARQCTIVVTIHHTPAFHELAAPGRTALVEAIKDFKAGLIDQLETPHEGVARTLSLLGVPCAHRRNLVVATPPIAGPRTSRPGVHIGIFGTGMPWKNMDAQILAAALVLKNRPGGSIHVQRIGDPSLMRALGVEYEVHPRLDGPAFAALLASMTVNLAVNFTETFGYLAVESFLLGAPCLFSPMTPAFAGVDPQNPLWRCRVDRIDDPAFIAAKIDEVLEHRDEVAQAGRMFCQRHVSDVQGAPDPDSRETGFPAPERTEPSSGRGGGLFARVLRYAARPGDRAPLDAMLDATRRIRATADVLAVTPSPDDHGPLHGWLGVNRATHALFPDRVLEMPLAIAGSRERDLEMRELARQMAVLGFTQVILSGFPACSESLARGLSERGIRVGCMFHGFVAACWDPVAAEAFGTVLRLCREGVIAKLACNKKGLPQSIEKITGVKAHKFMIPTRLTGGSAPPRRSATGGLHIGVLGQDLFRKNIHNQVAAALLIDGATVHVAGESRLDYWGCQERFVRHPAPMPHRDYVDLLGQMDLTLHLSFSESWGQVTAESLAMGVPCMIANHSDIYDYDRVLRDRLVSESFDDPDQLSREIRIVLHEREALAERAKAYVGVLNRRAEAHLSEFLAL